MCHNTCTVFATCSTMVTLSETLVISSESYKQIVISVVKHEQTIKHNVVICVLLTADSQWRNGWQMLFEFCYSLFQQAKTSGKVEWWCVLTIKYYGSQESTRWNQERKKMHPMISLESHMKELQGQWSVGWDSVIRGVGLSDPWGGTQWSVGWDSVIRGVGLSDPWGGTQWSVGWDSVIRGVGLSDPWGGTQWSLGWDCQAGGGLSLLWRSGENRWVYPH